MIKIAIAELDSLLKTTTRFYLIIDSKHTCTFSEVYYLSITTIAETSLSPF